MKTSPLPRAERGARRPARYGAAGVLFGGALLVLVALLGAPRLLWAAEPGEVALLELSSFPRTPLTIHSATSTASHVFRVWIADTPQRQSQGLMFVRDLPADEGMLFHDRQSRVWGMWMKNTFIPLDMLFIDARGRVVGIIERTVPHSLQTQSHPQPVKAVLELRGGEAARRGIRVGDRVEHPAFRNRPAAAAG